jgi:hypothetical protein
LEKIIGGVHLVPPEAGWNAAVSGRSEVCYPRSEAREGPAVKRREFITLLGARAAKPETLADRISRRGADRWRGRVVARRACVRNIPAVKGRLQNQVLVCHKKHYRAADAIGHRT